MSQVYLLDTNIIVPILNRDIVLRNRIETIDFVISGTILGELYFGAYRSGKQQENLAKIEIFKTQCTIINCDEGTSDIYGQIKQQLRVKGRPIPENDIWIGATAIQHDLILVSRDMHFQEVDNLHLEKW